MSKCLTYYVRLDENLAPIASTMMGYSIGGNKGINSTVSTNALPCGAGCNYVPLSPTGYTAPAGKTQCHFPNGTRYFYQIYRKSGNIVPNSLRESLIFPTDLNSCQWVEYKKFC